MKPLSLLFLLTGITSSILAHQGVHNSGNRIWKDSSGKFSVEASYVRSSGGKVYLKKTDQTVISVTIQRLSAVDRNWISQADKPSVPLSPQAAFQPFAQKVKTSVDQESLYIESTGMPDHNMMVGITAWQQQVPLPQSFTGENSWKIPLHPQPAATPISAKTNFFRGAIALAVNGVPIFNPIKNNGVTDTFLAGELDKWGGHCSRADDYHYHVAPVHLQEVVGANQPIAYALDGYPIYGFQHKGEALDKLNGHKDSQGNYHYHATKTYPYLNGGFYGKVTERNGQVDPQPRGQPYRPALPPLRGAKITGFSNPSPNNFQLEYKVQGSAKSLTYQLHPDKSVTFQFPDNRSETYTPRTGKGDRKGPKPPRPQGKPPKRKP